MLIPPDECRFLDVGEALMLMGIGFTKMRYRGDEEERQSVGHALHSGQFRPYRPNVAGRMRGWSVQHPRLETPEPSYLVSPIQIRIVSCILRPG